MDLDCSDLEDTHKIKVVLLGDRSVGKSSIIKRFIRDEFDDHLNVLRSTKSANRWDRFYVQTDLISAAQVQTRALGYGWTGKI